MVADSSLLVVAAGILLLPIFFSKRSRPLFPVPAPPDPVQENVATEVIIMKRFGPASGQDSGRNDGPGNPSPFDVYRQNIQDELTRPLRRIRLIDWPGFWEAAGQWIRHRWEQFQLRMYERTLRLERTVRGEAGQLVAQPPAIESDYIEADNRVHEARNNRIDLQIKQRRLLRLENAQLKADQHGIALGAKRGHYELWKDRRAFLHEIEKSKATLETQLRAAGLDLQRGNTQPTDGKDPEVVEAERNAQILKHFSQLAIDLEKQGYAPEDARKMAQEAYLGFKNRKLVGDLTRG